ncbi:hypothetical protein QN277_008079 [Acacia crassicarpa]|uniref:Uncharacterized protein n=1 Tax=Acacia crassicarpa TaxID=499986 RepID=A0AAE1IR17_9FABA|nr:hypothetical protein QN277_008079 [Acacia crassicarpa]
MGITEAKSTRPPPNLPPRRGQVKIRALKAIFKSVAALACGSAPAKNGGGHPPASYSTSTTPTPPVPSGYNTSDD